MKQGKKAHIPINYWKHTTNVKNMVFIDFCNNQDIVRCTKSRKPQHEG